jgi:hypothetical protein
MMDGDAKPDQEEDKELEEWNILKMFPESNSDIIKHSDSKMVSELLITLKVLSERLKLMENWPDQRFPEES